MSDRMISSIWSWLKSRHISVPQDWVAACLEWISSENQNVKDEVVVRKMVYEQWLLTDLRDFGEGCLPSGVKDESFTLKGTFCVQIDNVDDVSRPKYAQLLQRQNKESGNTLISAETQPTQKPWEAKPTRMLMMKVTDGVTELSAMEYMTITELTDKLPPGSKIRIKGPIKCRRGVLMLKQSNFELLGGEVEDLFATNNYEAVLCRGLGRPLPSNSNPVAVAQSNRQIQQSSVNPEILDAGIADEDLHDILADAEFDDDFDVDELPNLEKRKTASDVRQSSSDVIILSDDETLANILDDADNDELIASADLPPFPAKTAKFECVSSHTKIKPKQEPRSPMNRAVKEESNVRESETGMHYSDMRNVSHAPNSNPALKLNNAPNKLHITALLQSKTRPGATFQEFSRLGSTKNNALQGASGDILGMKAVVKDFKVEFDQSSTSRMSDVAPVGLEQSSSYSQNTAPKTVVSEKDMRQYLCHAKNGLLSNPCYKKLNVRVKAIVITLLSKLNSDIISGWSLKARICDGTAMLDVEFGNSVLQKLIGFSVADREAIKQTQNSNEKQKLIAGLNKCRETIISMCDYMGVEVRILDDNQLMGFVTDLDL